MVSSGKIAEHASRFSVEVSTSHPLSVLGVVAGVGQLWIVAGWEVEIVSV